MIQPKFEIGQKVFYVQVNWSATEVPCPDCLGKRIWHVTAPSGEAWDVMCNTCSAGYYSKGTVTNYADRVSKRQYTVRSQRIDTGDAERPISYMCEETSNGQSGSIYEEKCLFANEFEADKYGESELARVQGLRQAEELKTRKRKKSDSVYKLKVRV